MGGGGKFNKYKQKLFKKYYKIIENAERTDRQSESKSVRGKSEKPKMRSN